MQIPTSQTIILINFFRYLQSIYFNQLLCRGSVLSKIIHSILQIYRVNIFHKKSRAAADVHEQDGGFVLEEFRMDHQGGIPLWEQLHILDGHFVGDALELEAYRLGRRAKVLPEGFFLPAKPGQRKAGCDGDGALRLGATLLDFFGDGRKGQQVVVLVFHLVSQDRLSAGSAHEELSTVLQRVLQGVGLMGIGGDTGWERKMPGLDGVVAMVDADVHGFAHPFLAAA